MLNLRVRTFNTAIEQVSAFAFDTLTEHRPARVVGLCPAAWRRRIGQRRCRCACAVSARRVKSLSVAERHKHRYNAAGRPAAGRLCLCVSSAAAAVRSPKHVPGLDRRLLGLM
jgi:hypothetical protein